MLVAYRSSTGICFLEGSLRRRRRRRRHLHIIVVVLPLLPAKVTSRAISSSVAGFVMR